MKALGMALVAVGLAFAPLAQAQDVHVVSVVLKDGRIEPAVLEVPAGRRIKILVSNEGATPIEFESLPLKFEKVLAPGAKSSVVINPLKPGEYAFFDEFHPQATGKIVAK
ncbi:MAG: cupredoxin domain-containing protein [Burkholderiales bacterium]|nr:cupredoxin domain-containing protein [Burkholderiales bacterium]